MNASNRMLCALYGLVSLVALVATWANALDYLQWSFVDANLRFWQDSLSNPASRFITLDLLFLSLALVVWAVSEARRLHLRGVWLYVIGAVLIGVSIFIPLFLLHRQRALALYGTPGEPGLPGTWDVIGMVVYAVLVAGFWGYTLLH